MRSSFDHVRVAVFASGDLWAGAAVQIHTLLAGMVRETRLRPHVVALNEGEFAKRVRELSLSLTILPEERWSERRLLLSIRRFLSEVRPDLIHVNEYKLQLLVTAARAMARLPIPIVRTYHSRPLPEESSRKVRLFQVLDLLALRWFTSQVVTVSEDLATWLAPRLGPVPVGTIHNAITAPAQAESREEIRKRFEIQDDQLWIGTAIRLEATKEPWQLTAMAASLRAEGVRFVLSVFGDGSLRQRMLGEVRDKSLSGVVRLHGHDPNVAKVMPGWDAFVLCSRHEGMPMSLLEAMSVGAVPVCTRVGGIPEAVTHEESGLLVPPGDAPALAHAMCRLARDPRLAARLGEGARLTMARRFQVSRMVERYREIYEASLLGRDPAARRGEAA